MENIVSMTVKSLFGIDYLFPYQRLVVANIIEAAEACGIGVHWPSFDECEDEREDDCEYEAELYASEASPVEYGASPTDDKDFSKDESSCLGRQIVILPTGAGKSLCFQFPAMLLEGATLVIYPILSLMADQERRLMERGFEPVILRGGQSAEEREAIWSKVESGLSKFIIANPEVLLTEKVLSRISTLGIVHVVIDEAHCVSEWGESFRPSYLEIHKIIKVSGAPLVTAFTATASASVLEKIDKYIFGSDGEAAHRIIGNPDRSNISYSSVGCILRDIAVRDLLERSEKPAIVFCSSRPGTEKLSRFLRNYFGTSEVRFYHAGLERAEKADVEKWFFSSADGVLVATCAYGMGVDKANIRTVIHRDCPPSVEAYLQESGRAGRDGGFSRAYLLWGPDDEAAMRRAKNDSDRQRLRELFAFARDNSHCRREALLKLLNYEGELSFPESECCDVCASRAKSELREAEPLKKFFCRNRRAFNFEEASSAIIQNRALNWSAADANTAIRRLLKDGVLQQYKHFPLKGKISVK
jgi:ATP-dependent DNA helicase RecQ